ncbi:unnamed protein product, partial [Closterium sp. NIES-53]
PEPLSLQQLREWLARRTRHLSGAAGAGATEDTGAGGAGVTAGAGGTGGAAAAGPGGARTRGNGAAGTGGGGGAGSGEPTEPGAVGAGGAGAEGTSAGGAGARGAGAGGARAGGTGIGGTGAGGAGAWGAGGTGAGGTMRPRPYFVPLLQQPPLQPASPLPAPSPYSEQTGGLTERHEPASRPASPVRTDRRVPRLRPPHVPGTHAIALRPSSVPLRVPLPTPLDSSLLAGPDPESDRARTASPTVSRLLATVITDPYFESNAASALVAEHLEFAVACRLDYATTLVAESESASPPFVGGECAVGTDVLEDRQENFECLATAVPRFASMLLAPEGDPDALDIPTPRSYVEAITAQLSCRAACTRRSGCAAHLTSLGRFLQAPSGASGGQSTVSARHLVLQRFSFQFSSPQPTPLSTSHSLSAPPLDKSVEPSGPYPELVGCLMYLMTCTRPYLAHPLSLLARYMAPGLHLQPRFRLCFQAFYPLVFGSQLQL